MQDTLLDLINQTELEEEAALIAGDSYIYAVSCPELGVIKIGVSGAPARRLAELQSCFPCDLHHEAVWIGSFNEEQEIHRKLSVHRKRSEWFRLAPSDAVRTITAILDREPIWRADRIFKQEIAAEIPLESSTHIQAFIDRWVVCEPGLRITVGALYKAYARWCTARGGESLGKVTFTRAVMDLGIAKTPGKIGGQIWFLDVGLRTRTGTP